MKRFSKLLGIGIISGLILGSMLGIIQRFTNKKVYLLLMNVDYIPIVKDWNVGPGVPGMGAGSRVKVPNSEGSSSCSSRQGHGGRPPCLKEVGGKLPPRGTRISYKAR